jgi:hypothetical protein
MEMIGAAFAIPVIQENVKLISNSIDLYKNWLLKSNEKPILSDNFQEICVVCY